MLRLTAAAVLGLTAAAVPTASTSKPTPGSLPGILMTDEQLAQLTSVPVGTLPAHTGTHFDCKVREYAYEYAQKLQSWRGPHLQLRFWSTPLAFSGVFWGFTYKMTETHRRREDEGGFRQSGGASFTGSPGILSPWNPGAAGALLLSLFSLFFSHVSLFSPHFSHSLVSSPVFILGHQLATLCNQTYDSALFAATPRAHQHALPADAHKAFVDASATASDAAPGLNDASAPFASGKFTGSLTYTQRTPALD